jgi:hypothetical protein
VTYSLLRQLSVNKQVANAIGRSGAGGLAATYTNEMTGGLMERINPEAYDAIIKTSPNAAALGTVSSYVSNPLAGGGKALAREGVEEAIELGTKSAVREGAEAAPRVLDGAAEKFIGQGFSPAVAEHLALPYPSTGKGHHSFITQAMGRKYSLPNWMVDNPLNVLKPKGISRGDFYELHYQVDPDFFNANFPKAIGGSWTGSSLGLKKYTGIERVWHASPTPLKVTVGGTVTAGAGAAYYYSGDEE